LNNKYNTYINNKSEISYKSFILAILLKLGLNLSNKGTFYLTDMILIALQLTNIYDNDIDLKQLREKLATIKNISPITIKTNIDYAFKCRNTLKAEKNFETIFGFEYDDYYITTKSIISLILNQIYSKEFNTLQNIKKS